MIGKLTQRQIDEVLKSHYVGRIGYISGSRAYIVPVSYVFDGLSILVHSSEGRKIEAMRQNPNVCFEVDDINDLGNWKSVVCQGRYDELTDPEDKRIALRMLLNRSIPSVSSSTMHLGFTWPFYSDEVETVDGIFFRIQLLHRTGRFEKNFEHPVMYG